MKVWRKNTPLQCCKKVRRFANLTQRTRQQDHLETSAWEKRDSLLVPGEMGSQFWGCTPSPLFLLPQTPLPQTVKETFTEAFQHLGAFPILLRMIVWQSPCVSLIYCPGAKSPWVLNNSASIRQNQADATCWPGDGVTGMRGTPSPCSPGAHTGDWNTDYVGNINKVLCEQSPGLLILPRGQEAVMEKMQFFLCFEFSNLWKCSDGGRKETYWLSVVIL